jgi:NADH dehydrogenase
MSEEASERALGDLKVLGVEVRLSTLVTDMDARGVFLSSSRLEAGNVFWAAGVRAASLSGTLAVPTDRAGRVIVRPDCSVPERPEVFVIGDQAAQVDAQGALQMGVFVGNILHEEINLGATPGSRGAFCYRDKGSMATIGRARAVADIAQRTYGGLVAWLLWCVVHVMFLVCFRNRLFVMFGWAYGYLIHMGGARLITGTVGPLVSEASERRPEPSHARELGS